MSCGLNRSQRLALRFGRPGFVAAFLALGLLLHAQGGVFVGVVTVLAAHRILGPEHLLVGAVFGVGQLVAGGVEGDLGADQARLVGKQLVEGDGLALQLGGVGLRPGERRVKSRCANPFEIRASVRTLPRMRKAQKDGS